MAVQRPCRFLIVGFLLLFAAEAAHAQTLRWTGASISPADSNWSNPSNWLDTGGGFPTFPNANTATALFDQSSAAVNGRTSLNLGGGPFALNSLRFDTAAAAAYNIGGGGGGTLDFQANGATTPTLVMTSTVTASQLISGSVNLSAALTVNQNSTAASLTVSGAITGANALTKSGSGTLLFTGTNSYTTTTISAGVLQIGSGGAAGTLGSGAVTNNATLRYNRSGTTTVSNAVSGTGALVQAGPAGSVLVLTGANSYAGTTTVNASTTVQVGGGGTAGTLGSGAVTNNGTLAFNRSDALTVAGAISGTGVVNQIGAGTTTLTGSNTYTGVTTISAGTLQIGSGGAAGTLGSGAVTNNGTLAFNRSDALTVANVISGTGGVTQIGGGVTTLSGTNTYTGINTVSGGVLSVSALADGGVNSNLGASTNAAANLVLNGGTLRYTGAAQTSDRLFTVGTTGGTIEANGTGALTLTNTGAVGLSGTNTARTLTLGGTSTDANTLSAVLGDNGTGVTSLVKAGVGTWVLSGTTSTYTGATVISGGVLSVAGLANGGATSSIGASTADAANLVLDGGTLRPTAGGTTDRLFTISTAGGTIDASGSNPLQFTNAGAIALTGTNAARTLTLTGSNTGVNILAAALGDNGTGATSVAKTGGGTWLLTGNNTYTGGTTISGGGSLHVGNGGTTGTLGTGPVTVNNAQGLYLDRSDTFTLPNVVAGTGEVIQFTTGTTVLTGNNTLSGTWTISAGALQVGNGGTSGSLGTAAVTNNGTLIFNRSDALTVGNVISGSGGVTLNGTGTVYLNAANTYTGATTVNAGTLGGTGTAGGATTVSSGSTLQAGTAANPTGTLTLANGLTMQGGSTLGVRITTAGSGGAGGFSTDNGGVHNKLAVAAGGTTLNSLMNILVDVTGATFSNNVQQSYRVLTGAGDQSGLSITDPARFTFVGLTGPDTFEAINTSLTGNAGGEVFLTFTPVPEPATVLGVGAAVLGLAAVARRRRKAAEALAA